MGAKSRYCFAIKWKPGQYERLFKGYKKDACGSGGHLGMSPRHGTRDGAGGKGK